MKSWYMRWRTKHVINVTSQKLKEYIYTVYKTLRTLPNIELLTLLLSEQSQFVRAWTLQGVESVPPGSGSLLTPMLPTVMSSWLDVLWVVDHSWYTQETVEREKPIQRCSSWHKPVHLAPTTIPCSKVLKYFVLPIHPQCHTYCNCNKRWLYKVLTLGCE